tara:strand:- start:104 stop:2011 length:1908 start_codon:yes stop_codon:yes gene_type:complete
MLRKLLFKPGVNKDITDYSAEGGWYNTNKVRFVSGFPKKIGGYAKYTVSAFIGICRTMFNYTPSGAYKYMALGTSKKVYLDTGGTLNDITGIRLTTSAGDATFTSTSGSAIITVTENSHGANAGDYVTFSAAATLGSSNITATILNKEYVIDTITNANVFTFTATVTSDAAVSGGGGGSTIAAYQMPVGYNLGTEGFGWGTEGWDVGTWGTASETPIYLPLRIVHFTKYFDDLVFNARYATDGDDSGQIYYYANDTSLNTRGVLMSTLAGASNVPTRVTQVLISQDNTSGTVLALGCTPYGLSAHDPLCIRWSDATVVAQWTPSDLTTAGSLNIQNGSAIMTGVPTYNETLIFTESSINSLKFIGGFEVFRLDEISNYISLVAPNAVSNVDSSIFWMGTNKFYVYNGRVQTLPCTLEDHVFKNFNSTQTDQFFAGLNAEYHEVWWFYCSSASTTIDKYVVYNYLESIWFHGECDDNFDRTAWSDSTTREYPQAASDDGYVYNHEYGNDADGAALTANITSASVSLDEGDRFTLIRKIIPDVTFIGSDTNATPSVSMGIQTKKFPGSATKTTNQENESLSNSVTAVSHSIIDQFTEQIYVRARGRQMALTVESTGTGVAWQLGTPRADIRPDGLRG